MFYCASVNALVSVFCRVSTEVRMNERDKVRLQLNSRSIIDNLIVQDVLDHLYTKRVLSQKDVESLMNDEPSRSTARRLVVSLLPRKGPEAFALFCEALREAEYEYLAEQLEKTQVRDEDVSSASQDNNIANTQYPSKCYASSATPGSDVRNASDFRDELNELREMMNQVKVKRQVDDLERENFFLKKQLSFYEEKENADAGGRRSRISSSDRVTSSSPNAVSTHRKRNSFAGFTASWPETPFDESLLTRINSEPITTIFDRDNDDVMDSPLDDLDSSELSFRLEAYFEDVVDGLSPREETSRAQACAASEVTSFPVHELSESDSNELSHVLVYDVITHFTSIPQTAIDVKSALAQYCDVMRRAVGSMTRKHGPILEQISRGVDLSQSWSECCKELDGLCMRFLADDFRHAPLFWGRTVAIFTLFGFVAKKLRKYEKDSENLRDFCVKFVDDRMQKKIKQVGGWVRNIKKNNNNNNKILFLPVFQANSIKIYVL